MQETTEQSMQTGEVTSTPQTPDMLVTAPGQLRVIKRNGAVVPFDENKIYVAMMKAFLAVEGGNAAASNRIHDAVTAMVKNILGTFQRRLSTGGTLHIEEIQDQVELTLMRSGDHKVARSYVLYRESRAQERAARHDTDGQTPDIVSPQINVKLSDGTLAPLDSARIQKVVFEACSGLEDVQSSDILDDLNRNLYDGVSQSDVNSALTMSARTLIEKEPNYGFVTARLLLDSLRSEALSFLGLAQHATHAQMQTLYAISFAPYIEKGIDLELLSPRLAEFDLDLLGKALVADRDLQFNYLGLQTLYDRYFLHSDEVRFELPQIFFMRVAMGLSLNEDNPNQRAIEFYNLLSSFNYMSSTPTLFNSGTLRPQLSSCYLTTVPDDLMGIYGAIQDNAMLSKWAGGLGNDWTPVRALGAYIKGTNGKSQGIVPFLKVANDTAVAVNQGGKRKGAVCAYLETWHLDIEEFLELRKNTGDDRRRTHDMNTANWIPDLFMKRVFADAKWTLFSPDAVPDLHDLYGLEFEQRYVEYEHQVAQGVPILHKVVNAKDLWRKMLSMLFETGHPWITFKDACNLRSPQQHAGVVHSSNLCTEITLNTSEDEIAVCNLGSVNLIQHLKSTPDASTGELSWGLDVEKLEQTVRTAIRMLDNVIDINYYAVPQAKNSNSKHRPIGLGVMGFQDALYQLNCPYGSAKAVEFADRSMEAISYFAIKASSDLAVERGSYESYAGSLWNQGILPIDSLELLAHSRQGTEEYRSATNGSADSDITYLKVDRTQTMDWAALRELIRLQGMRNSNTMAIAPTATIANITGVSQSIEPTYQNLYVKSNLSGEFTVVNPYLVKALKEAGVWDNVMVNDLKYYDGSVANIDRIPEALKELFATAFEVEPRWLVESASRRQKWIDQAQSLNLYIKEPNGKKLDVTYRMAWLLGLKTTYYLRALGATSTEKSTLHTGQLNAVKSSSDVETAMVCSIDDPDCEACQ